MFFWGIALFFAWSWANSSWSFAIMADTQWALQKCTLIEATGDSLCVSADSLSGYRNPNSVSVDFIHQIQERLILNHHVKFLVLLGDFGDAVDIKSVQTRATWAQELYDAKIGVFPVRGNHDEGPLNAREFLKVFPQTRDGEMNKTPPESMIWTDSAQIHPRLVPGSTPFTVGSNFSSPACAPGRSYAFEEEGASFVFIDIFMDEKLKYCEAKDQITWIDSVLSAKPSKHSPAFVFSHKPLIGACHDDNLFGPTAASDSLNTVKFMETLVRNGVRIYIAGHDHLLQHSIIDEPGDGGLWIQQAIFPGASWKFYPSLYPTIDEKHNVPAYGKKREIPLAQELAYIGYQIVEIDGERVEITSWGAPTGLKYMGELEKSEDMREKWSVRRVFGWSSRGKEVLLAPNESMSSLSDSSLGTQANVLSGVWKASNRDFSRREFSALVSTDWRRFPELKSASWTLWGLEKDNGTSETPTFALSMGIDSDAQNMEGLCLLHERSGVWECAGQGEILQRAYQSGDALGTQGIDPVSREAWAVVNRGGTYAVGFHGTLGIQKKAKNSIVPFKKSYYYDLLGRQLHKIPRHSF
ncbi:MAG: hypothetical protein GX116_09105 [Fibrobacter sp.]|nr:hypothetical protein [Fibrobacter sp.]